MSTKFELRARMKNIRAEVPLPLRKNAATQVAELDFPQKGWILSYASFGSELSTELLNQKLAQEKRLVLPKRVGNTLKLFMSLEAPRHEEKKLWESWDETHEIDPHHIRLAVVPALAFDPFGFRLGYGKGYYDKLLPLLEAPTPCWGVGFSCQMLDKLPRETHDIRLSKVILLGDDYGPKQ